MRISDYTDPRDLPYTADVVVWREGDYAVAKIHGEYEIKRSKKM